MARWLAVLGVLVPAWAGAVSLDIGYGDDEGQAAWAVTTAAAVYLYPPAAGGAAPAPQAVTVTNAGGGTLGAVTTAVAYAAGADWLTVAASGSGDHLTLDNTVASGSLPAGGYAATVTVSAAPASPLAYPVALTVTPPGAWPGDAGAADSGAGAADSGAGDGRPGDHDAPGGAGCAAAGVHAGARSTGLLLLAGVALRALVRRPRARRSFRGDSSGTHRGASIDHVLLGKG